MTTMQVFVSHSHKDDDFCRALVNGLRSAGVDVWYDEHNMGSGRLGPTIERELRRRPVFVVVLSPAALRSQWVEDETRWAYGLLRRNASRIMLPITAATLDEDDIWLFLQDFKRIESAGLQPYPIDEAVHRLLRALALTRTEEVPAPTAPQRTESADGLLERGKALQAQGRYAEALPLVERVVHHYPTSYDGWFNLGQILHKLGRHDDALSAYDQMLALTPGSSSGWYGKSETLRKIGRNEEADRAYEVGFGYAVDAYYSGRE